MDPCALSPYLRVAMDSVIDPPWELRPRAIFDYELLYVKEGHALITVEGAGYDALPGSFFLFRPRQLHSIRLVGNSRFRQPHLHFDLFYRPDSPFVKVSFKPPEEMTREERALFRDDVTSACPVALPTKIVPGDARFFESLLFDVIREHQSDLPYHEIYEKALFLKLWACLLRENALSHAPDAAKRLPEFEAMRQYIAANASRRVTLDELSKRFHISKYHLDRHFTRLFGVSPVQFGLRTRIDQAKERIEYSSASLTEIAESFGFGNINAFSRAFRRSEGVPPSYYRRSPR